jgi:diaminopimelate epimerase
MQYSAASNPSSDTFSGNSVPSLPFTKMEGLGNDFIVIDDLSEPSATNSPLTAAFAQKICDRRFGVGADQILWLRKARGNSDVRMEILNADGSEAEMCGNGIRAVALYLQAHGPDKKTEYEVETLAGIKKVKIRGSQVLIDMGPPRLGLSEGEEIKVAAEVLRFYEVNVGNPHAVFFVEDVNDFPVEELGPLIEKNSRFPERTNVEFVEVLDSNSIRVRVWERGAGITLACGTGACASAVASLATGRVNGTVEVQLPGGALRISWAGVGHSILMEGPAKEVFRGIFPLE